MDEHTENHVSDDHARKKRKPRLHARFEPETFTAIASDIAEDIAHNQAVLDIGTKEEKRSKKRKHKSKELEDFDELAIAQLAAENVPDDDPAYAEGDATIQASDDPRRKKASRKRKEPIDGIVANKSLVPKDEQQGTGRKAKGILKGVSSKVAETEEEEPDAFEVTEDKSVPTRKVKKPKKTKAEKDKRTLEEKEAMKQEWTNSAAALEYLRKWKNAREDWSFQKVRQIWVLRNWQDANKMSDEDFDILLEYVVALKGGSRTKTLEEAKKIVDDYESTESYGDADELKKRVNERASQMVDVLST